MFAGNFAPRTWALCDGQLLSINQNTALFSILGTIYGGDGRTTFALPDCRGRAVLGPGNGPGLPSYREGQKAGQETIILHQATMPSHNHSFSFDASSDPATPGQGQFFAPLNVIPNNGNAATASRYSATPNASLAYDAFILGNTGGGQPYPNMMPSLAVNYIICLQGVFPSRS